MGAWGVAIFADDTACDVRDSYRELLVDRVPDADATRRVLAEFDYVLQDDSHILWLALAAAQHEVGRLDDQVRTNALEVIASGRGLDLWDEAGQRAARVAVLQRLARKLVGPQPAPKTIRATWKATTDLRVGDLLGYIATDDTLTAADDAVSDVQLDDEAVLRGTCKVAVFLVAEIGGSPRMGTWPSLVRLVWDRPQLPSVREAEQLPLRTHAFQSRPDRIKQVLDLIAATRHRKTDADWSDVGFIRFGVINRPIDLPRKRIGSLHTAWEGVVRGLATEFATGRPFPEPLLFPRR